MASATASSFGRFCTITGPSMTFCSTVLCGNRLWLWNTKPLRDWNRRTSGFGVGVEKSISTSSTRITPAVGPVERVQGAQQRRLARARRPDDGGAPVPVATLKDTPCSTLLSPNAFSTPSAASTSISVCGFSHRATYLSSRCSTRACPNDSTRQITQ